MCSAPTLLPISSADARSGIPLVGVGPGTLEGYAVSEVGTAVDRALDRNPWGVVLDLSGIDAMTRAGLAMLIRVVVRAGQLDVGLCLVCSDAVRSVVVGAEVEELFEMHTSVGAALAALGVTH
jgi:anti-anti-sigma regulatory factor